MGVNTRYIGATTRMLSSRLDEHQDDVMRGRHTTELAKKPKTHKTNWPLRPLVNKRSHPTYYLEKVLAKCLRAIVPESPYVTPSSVVAKSTIASSIGALQPCTYTFYKLDVISLYPSVPTFEAVMLANSLLLKEGFNIQQVLDIRDALTFVTEHNYFCFNRKIYLQKQGVPMGSPLSAILAELVMREIERRTFDFPLAIHYPRLYLRYVDDILIAWEDTEESFLIFMQQLASIYPSINFTWEKERDAEVAFLDLHIRKFAEGLQFSVYHKSGMAPHIIPAEAFQPSRYVNTAIASLVRRAYLLSSTQELINVELEIIDMAVRAAGFSRAKFTYVLNKVNKALFPCTTLCSKRESSKVQVALPYFGPISLRICRIFKQHNLVLPLTPLPSLRKLICNDRDKFSILEKSGVYAVPLENQAMGVNTRYIGATTRMLSSRLDEHQDDIMRERHTTELAKKVLEQGYNPLWSQAVMLKSCKDRKTVFIWESLLTTTLDTCNTPTLELPSVWVTLYKRLGGYS
ncbi:uncharacterized protein LOC111618072 [Centruroides sculpturatus]|uniref:uncharacterized protein LOC111618072 n=1 Tax=Centruroides sculpturatus TaxID=218467 RepID=UPI000C6EC64A|nr:uncharacterized protein LOC111618072 [Centruroides sculpturatus]